MESKLMDFEYIILFFTAYGFVSFVHDGINSVNSFCKYLVDKPDPKVEEPEQTEEEPEQTDEETNEQTDEETNEETNEETDEETESEKSSESEYEDLRDETYTQPNNYISKLRKRQRNTI